MYFDDYITNIIKASKILLSSQATHCQDKYIHICFVAEDFPTQIPKEERAVKIAITAELTPANGGRKLMDL